MGIGRTFNPTILLLGAIAIFASPAGATTLIRMGLDELVSTNQDVVVGQVVDAVSYWNSDGTFILTDVVIRPDETLKGTDRAEVTVTVMGGTVGDLSTLIIGGAELFPGRSYVLFLNPEDLPGSPQTLTVRDHSQGVFEIQALGDGELRAISQANAHPLVPDQKGLSEAPGGFDGFPLGTLLQDLKNKIDDTTGEKGSSK